MYDQWIVFHDLNPGNILVQRLGFDEFRLVVIDGIGHNHFIPLASYSSGFARKKLVRVWNRRYRHWYAAFPSVIGRLRPYPIIRS
jgi:sulfite reductase beta subunit-like hemoprotein